MFVCCECCVLSGRGLCDEMITRPEESYQMWCAVESDLDLKNEGAMTRIGSQRHRKKKYFVFVFCNGFGGLEVACWPLVPKFAGSNPAEAVGFLRAKKSSARLPSEGK